MRWLVLALCLAAFAAAKAQAAPGRDGLGALMQSMAQVRTETAHFTERKSLPMLSAPLQLSGTLAYRAPDYVRKTTAPPYAQNFVLQGGEITLTGQDGQTHHFSVAQDPEIGDLAEGIRAVLAGDLPALQRVFKVAYAGSPQAWRIVLTPKDKDLTHFVARIVVTGAGDEIRRIDTFGGDGSDSEMRITEDRRDAN